MDGLVKAAFIAIMQTSSSITERVRNKLHRELLERQHYQRLSRLAADVVKHSHPAEEGRPVIFFKASTDTLYMSLNSGFHLIAAWALRLQGVPVIHFTCQSGMSRCVLGTDRDDPSALPPCEACIAKVSRQYHGAEVRSFSYQEGSEIKTSIQELDLSSLTAFEYQDLPFGKLVLPSLRWVLRRHHLNNDEATRFLYREYILSAWNIAQEFTKLLDDTGPQAVVVFNGMFFPEAVARHIALGRGIRVVAHEVALQPFTAFFTEGEATAYPIEIPEDFELSQEQNQKLDQYLEERFKGNFTMAGIKFWPEMQRLPEPFLERMGQHKQVIPVFTNVIFDTSQPHSNVVFDNMFEWLDTVLDLACSHPDTFFVIRAHPDEKRTWKESRESVSDWVKAKNAQSLPNLAFFDSNEYVSSYDLIRHARFVMVYNSSIGLEASLMGAPVLCAGKARFTQVPTVYFPATKDAFIDTAERFLASDEITPPVEFLKNARKFLYFQLFRTSLPFADYLEAHPMRGMVALRDFHWQQLLPENSSAVKAVVDGILKGGNYLLEE